MSEVIHGACLCGAIAFDLHESGGSFAPPEWSGSGRPAMGICHCTRCQRWSGGSGLPFVVAAPDNLKVTKGHDLIARYREDGRGTIRTFCSQCGSSLYQDAGATTTWAQGSSAASVSNPRSTSTSPTRPHGTRSPAMRPSSSRCRPPSHEQPTDPAPSTPASARKQNPTPRPTRDLLFATCATGGVVGRQAP